MNIKATVTPELFGPADDQGRKLVYLRVFYRDRFSRFSTGCRIKLTKEEFNNRRLSRTGQALVEVDYAIAVARQVIDKLGNKFTFPEFKKHYRRGLFNRQPLDDITMQTAAKYYFQERPISFKTRDSYTISLNWLTRYTGNIRLTDISVDTINGLILFMKREHEKEDLRMKARRHIVAFSGHQMSENTVRLHIRHLRAIYNFGVKYADLDLRNPFKQLDGQPLSSIPREKGALSIEDLTRFIDYKPANRQEERAQDFFILTIQLSGANLGDILSFRNENIHGDQIWFRRRKTKRTGLITKIPLTPWARDIMNKYGEINLDKPQKLILPFLNGARDEKQLYSRVHDFGGRLNLGLKSIAAALGMEPFSMVIARHTYSVLSVSNGFSIEQIQHFMGHASPETTRIYVKSINNEVIQRSADMLESLRPTQKTLPLELTQKTPPPEPIQMTLFPEPTQMTPPPEPTQMTPPPEPETIEDSPRIVVKWMDF